MLVYAFFEYVQCSFGGVERKRECGVREGARQRASSGNAGLTDGLRGLGRGGSTAAGEEGRSRDLTLLHGCMRVNGPPEPSREA